MEILEEGEFQALIHKLCAVHKKETLGPAGGPRCFEGRTLGEGTGEMDGF